MVTAMQHLSKRTLAQRVNDLVTVGKVVVLDDEVIPSLVVVAIIVRRVVPGRHVFLASSTNTVHAWEVEHLLALVVAQVVVLR